jgi:hypothetical protein
MSRFAAKKDVDARHKVYARAGEAGPVPGMTIQFKPIVL